MMILFTVPTERVNCRIGSLENVLQIFVPKPVVNCRIGSLESEIPLSGGNVDVNCRIGSLEKLPLGATATVTGKLPNRQFRKASSLTIPPSSRKLPNRQFRNYTISL